MRLFYLKAGVPVAGEGVTEEMSSKEEKLDEAHENRIEKSGLIVVDGTLILFLCLSH